MKEDLVAAYELWVEAKDSCKCEPTGHYYKKAVKNRTNKNIPAIELIPKPDSEVCEREKAWRAYARLRGDVLKVKTPKGSKKDLSNDDIRWLKSVKCIRYIDKKVW